MGGSTGRFHHAVVFVFRGQVEGEVDPGWKQDHEEIVEVAWRDVSELSEETTRTVPWPALEKPELVGREATGPAGRPKRRVVVVEYDDAWPGAFERVKRVVAPVLGEVAMAIEHVGSTSVPGLAAKPIIDIDVIARPEEVETGIDRLTSIGYVHRGNLGIEGREAFSHPRVAPDGEPMPEQHLYVCRADGEEVWRHLAFRDYLRRHPEARERYAAVKREGARAHAEDRDAYQEYKSAVVREILTRALVEFQRPQLHERVTRLRQ